jgi:hypothetical protein
VEYKRSSRRRQEQQSSTAQPGEDEEEEEVEEEPLPAPKRSKKGKSKEDVDVVGTVEKYVLTHAPLIYRITTLNYVITDARYLPHSSNSVC